ELHCDSGINPEFFYQLSQICHNISLLDIVSFKGVVSDELTNLISVQKNLKYFSLTVPRVQQNILSSLVEKLPNTLIEFNLRGYDNISLSSIVKFTNLQ